MYSGTTKLSGLISIDLAVFLYICECVAQPILPFWSVLNEQLQR